MKLHYTLSLVNLVKPKSVIQYINTRDAFIRSVVIHSSDLSEVNHQNFAVQKLLMV